MKSNILVNAKRVTLFAAVLVAILIFASGANAQSTFQGTFTLGHSARWGKTVLGAGDYIVRVNNTNGSSPLVAEIIYAKSGRPAALETCSNVDSFKPNGEKSALLIGHRGNQQVVHSFRIAELGQTFIFDRTLASRQVSEEASNQENVPVLVVKQ
jgi:hypothetical protein